MPQIPEYGVNEVGLALDSNRLFQPKTPSNTRTEQARAPAALRKKFNVQE